MGFILFNYLVYPIATQRCRYWCKTTHDQFYCCPDGHQRQLHQFKESPWPFISDPSFWMGVLGGGVGWNYFGSHLRKPEESIHRQIKHCPPLRAGCPRNFDLSLSPEFCDNDYYCGVAEKCCYDVCIERKVCKPAE